MKSIKTRLMLWLMAWITTILGTTGLYFYIHDYNIDQNDFQTNAPPCNRACRCPCPRHLAAG
ncbi:Uncharacterised protein [Chromobacterium violaceum]|uniref:Uncharacterized protein n=1 Tax=Chromobacterium violaceum TaxID=536 RepID=A0A3S4HPP9_CHRVL|nr:Uncharacterised protein [Chromobacterium violaceum]